LKTSDRGQRARRLGAALLLLALPALPLQARGKSEAWASTQFSAAERLRESLNSLPPIQQTRILYQRTITAYRRVYYGSPASSKADPSVVAVAELLTDMGRRFNDPKVLRAAVGQYKFLRREYPGSRDRFDALFAIGQIYQDDLKDPAQAKAAFEEFVRRYPRNHLAEQARKALSDPIQRAGLKSKISRNSGEDDFPETKAASEKLSSGKTTKPSAADNAADGDDSEDAGESVKTNRVTSIRHWSTPEYTRVAIGLEKPIKFDSQRIEHPERIFFDLLETSVTPSLLKSVDVDDGLLKKIRVAQFQPGKSRIVLEVEDNSEYTTVLLADPPRLVIDVRGKNKAAQTSAKAEEADSENGKLSQDVPVTRTSPPASTGKVGSTANNPLPVTGNSISNSSVPQKIVVEAKEDDPQSAATVATLEPPVVKPAAKSAAALPGSTMSLPASGRSGNRGKLKPVVVFPDVHEASPTANGDRSLIRALGLKIGKIVIDPGHGGHDTGTIGPNGLEEKDLVLDVGRRLGKLLQGRMGADVVFTRKDDTFIPLETRTSIANQEQADLFVSIHANSSRDPDARGVETYYLNFTSSAEALDVAARENAASDKSIHELQDLVKKIALKEKIEESREFATNVQRALHTGLAVKSPGVRDRGIKKAPFIVLIGANMPSILAEISFVSNPGDERRLKTSDYRQRIAESLYRGISKYVSGLSGVKVASKIDKGDGQ
jgi:N-acetylmuramoyl-L-alanine amidase